MSTNLVYVYIYMHQIYQQLRNFVYAYIAKVLPPNRLITEQKGRCTQKLYTYTQYYGL